MLRGRGCGGTGAAVLFWAEFMYRLKLGLGSGL